MWKARRRSEVDRLENPMKGATPKKRPHYGGGVHVPGRGGPSDDWLHYGDVIYAPGPGGLSGDGVHALGSGGLSGDMVSVPQVLGTLWRWCPCPRSWGLSRDGSTTVTASMPQVLGGPLRKVSAMSNDVFLVLAALNYSANQRTM